MRNPLIVSAVAGMILAGTLGGAWAAPPVRKAPAPNVAAATILSSVAPGLGESYNSGWRNGFPWAECLVSTFLMGSGGVAIGNLLSGVSALNSAAPYIGAAATLLGTAIRLSSMIDAASGVKDGTIRADFWSMPE